MKAFRALKRTGLDTFREPKTDQHEIISND